MGQVNFLRFNCSPCFKGYGYLSSSNGQGGGAKIQECHFPLEIAPNWHLRSIHLHKIEFVQVLFAWCNHNNFTIVRFDNAFYKVELDLKTIQHICAH